MGRGNRRRLGLSKETLRRLDNRELKAVVGGGDAEPDDQRDDSNYLTCTCVCNPTIVTLNGGGRSLGC